MLDKDYNGLTAKKGALILFVCLMLAATVFVTNYLPYRTQTQFEERCTTKTTATVFGLEEQYRDGNMYYGPMMEFIYYEKGQLVHAEAASAIMHDQNYKEGETLHIGYDPNSPGDLYIEEDRTVQERWKTASVCTVLICACGVLMFTIGCVRSIRGTDKELSARKFIKTPDGKTFSEWAAEQQKKAAEQTSQTDENETEDR